MMISDNVVLTGMSGMNLDELDYELPADRIAQEPPADRLEAKLLVLDRRTGRIEHARFRDLADWLVPGDCLVINDTRVLPARIRLVRGTGGKIDGLFLREIAVGCWEVLLRNAGRLRSGERLRFADSDRGATYLESIGDGEHRIRVAPSAAAEVVLEEVGRTPLPPYIRREFDDPVADRTDRVRYQTEYAGPPGAVAAPTAGLHFTRAFLDELTAAKVRVAKLTLEVGLGTFQPIGVDRLEDHPMHTERYRIEAACAETIRQTRRAGGRIIAVGTTSTRALEATADETDVVSVGRGETDIFIYPPYRFRVVDVLLTNFHLPRSTLLALVFAFASREKTLEAYRVAIERGYRFYSYGDAMLIL